MLLLHTGGELTVGISTSYNYLIKRPKPSLKLLQALVRLGCKEKKKKRSLFSLCYFVALGQEKNAAQDIF